MCKQRPLSNILRYDLMAVFWGDREDFSGVYATISGVRSNKVNEITFAIRSYIQRLIQ